MVEDTDVGKVRTAAVVSTAIFFLLLIAPWTPPQVAIFAAGAIFMLGLATFFGLRYIVREMREGWQSAEEENPDAYEKYVDGEITEIELENELEDELQ